jgi:alpha-glucosidase
MARIVQLRYSLFPYIYSEYMKAALRDECMFKPLAFDYPDDRRAIQVEDQLMLGDEVMIAPVYTQNSLGRYVYLPEDMLMIRFRSPEDYDLVPMPAGDHRIGCSLQEFPLFVKRDHPVLLCPGGECTELLDDHHFTVLCLTDRETAYDLYRDDGISSDPVLSEHLTHVAVQAPGSGASSVPGVAISSLVL